MPLVPTVRVPRLMVTWWLLCLTLPPQLDTGRYLATLTVLFLKDAKVVSAIAFFDMCEFGEF